MAGGGPCLLLDSDRQQKVCGALPAAGSLELNDKMMSGLGERLQKRNTVQHLVLLLKSSELDPVHQRGSQLRLTAHSCPGLHQQDSSQPLATASERP